MATACASGGGTGALPSPGASPAPPSPTGSPAAPAFDGSGPYESNVTFPLTVATLDFTSSSPSPGFSNQGATVFVKTSSFNYSEIRLVIPSINIDTTITMERSLSTGYPYGPSTGLSYVALGNWSDRGLSNGPVHVWSYAFGYETAASAMPRTGTASYSGIGNVRGGVVGADGGFWADLRGDAGFTADFATGKIQGTLTNLKANVADELLDSPWNDVSITANIAAGTNRFSGTTSTGAPPSAPYTLQGSAAGLINGAFFGPAAENLGAVWTLSDGAGTAIGVVGAARQ